MSKKIVEIMKKELLKEVKDIPDDPLEAFENPIIQMLAIEELIDIIELDVRQNPKDYITEGKLVVSLDIRDFVRKLRESL